MAKGSVRKKGKKWYYRFYVEDESGRQVQREFAGTESKSETEALLRRAMEDYEAKKFVAKSENTTVGQLLDMWVEEELKPGNLSNGTVMAYQGTVNRIKQHPIGNRKLKSVTPDQGPLQPAAGGDLHRVLPAGLCLRHQLGHLRHPDPHRGLRL